MKLETINKLMGVGLTEDQLETVSNYITEILDDNKKESSKDKFEKLLTTGRHMQNHLMMVMPNYDELSKNDLLDSYTKLQKIDYNKFIEENSDLQVVQNFKVYVERNI